MSRVAPGWDLAVVALGKGALSLAVLSTGFVALSDDDFSRIVIAEEFVHSPSLDPSGTSWLPLPFWVHGTSMSLFGRTLATAHATSLMLGVISALCIHRAARWLRVSRPGSVLTALIASGILTAARLGVSTQPEALTAGLVVLGAAATRVDGSRRMIGGVALLAACLCRYEAWAAGAVFVLIAAYDAARGPRKQRGRDVLSSGFAPLDTERQYAGESDPPAPDDAEVAEAAEAASARDPRDPRRRLTLLAAAALAAAGPLAWIVHGAVSHDDALFFLHRVAAYRRALGATEPVVRSLFAYPTALFRAEPEVTLSALLVLRVAADRAPRALALLVRPTLVIGGVFVFLVVGRVLDGAPTHHAERTLLPAWTLLSVLVGEGLVRGLTPVRGHVRGDAVARTVPLAIAIGVLSLLLRAGKPPEPDAARKAERDIGIAARSRVAETERLLIDTRDYGYFAVIAAFGAPERARPVDRHDPREPHPEEAFASEERLSELLHSSGARWLAVRADDLPVAARLGTVTDAAGDLSLLRVSLP